MKRLALALTVLVAAPLFAEDKKEEPKPDSPLVAAARRSTRPKSTTPVITNATVKNSQGRLTTSSNNRTIVIPEPAPSSEVKHLQAQAKAKAEAAKVAAEAQAKQKKLQEEMARRVQAYEEGTDGNEETEVVVPPTP